MTSEPNPTPQPNEERLKAVLGFLSELGQVVASSAELQPILDWIAQRTTSIDRKSVV